MKDVDEGDGRFPTTQNSAIVGMRSPDAVRRAQSFETVTFAYYRPIYKYLRFKWRKDAEEAADLTQGFFAFTLEKGTLGAFDPDKGRFRTYLRTCLDNFVMSDARAARATKRGGQVSTLSLDFASTEAELVTFPALPSMSAEEYFDAELVRHLFAVSVESLRESCSAKGKDIHFTAFMRHDLHTDPATRPTHAELASELGISPVDVGNRLSYARRELRRIVLERLRELTATDQEFRMEALAILGLRVPGDAS